jgi:hypothetical protein
MRQAASHFNPSWFRDQVTNNGPWDYKQKGAMYQDFGNFNYGATCKAFGFPESICLREAGRRQQVNKNSQPNWGNPGSRANPWGRKHRRTVMILPTKAWIQRGMNACQCLSRSR